MFYMFQIIIIKKKYFYLRWTFFFFLQIKFTFAIYMNRWILPIGGVAWGRVCACSLRIRLVYIMTTKCTQPVRPNCSDKRVISNENN